MRPRKKNFYPFTLTEKDVEKIYQGIVTYIQQKKPTFTSTFVVELKDRKTKDEITRPPFHSPQELFSDVDTAQWDIKSLKITVCAKSSSEPQITIIFRKKTFSSVEYSFDGDYAWRERVSPYLEDKIKNIKKDTSLYVLALFVSIVSFIGLWTINIFRLSSNFSGNVLNFWLLVSICGVTGGFAYIYGTPPYNFFWGGYIQILERRRNWRNFFLVTLILAFFISLGATYVYPNIANPF